MAKSRARSSFNWKILVLADVPRRIRGRYQDWCGGASLAGAFHRRCCVGQSSVPGSWPPVSAPRLRSFARAPRKVPNNSASAITAIDMLDLILFRAMNTNQASRSRCVCLFGRKVSGSNGHHGKSAESNSFASPGSTQTVRQKLARDLHLKKQAVFAAEGLYTKMVAEELDPIFTPEQFK